MAPVIPACSNGAIEGTATRAKGPSGAKGGLDGLPQATLELEDSFELKPPSAQRVTVAKDPVFDNQKMTYQAYALLDVLKRAKDFDRIAEAAKTEPYALVFVALDRFRVTLPFEYAFNGKGFLAFREHERRDGNDWGLIPAQEQAKTPAPFYLVWDIPEPTFDFPVPYQVAYIKMMPLRLVFPDAHPKEPSLAAGFGYFASRCVWCHSVNFNGGRSAKEFNVPNNVTETLTRDAYKKHLSGQGNYGPRPPGCSKMWTKDADMEAVWDYLSHMKALKACDTEEACEKYKHK